VFQRRREIKVPPPPDIERIDNANKVLIEHRKTLIRVRSILEREVERIDKYLEKM
jgi:hypothetical protein